MATINLKMEHASHVVMDALNVHQLLNVIVVFHKQQVIVMGHAHAHQACFMESQQMVLDTVKAVYNIVPNAMMV
jgi:hypothetical protein